MVCNRLTSCIFAHMLLRGLVLLLSLVRVVEGEVRPALPVERLTTEAELVLRARVLSTTVQRDAAAGIFTKVDLAVQSVWKGTFAAPSIQVFHAGGVLGEVGRRVSGQSAYLPDEEVVLFLTRGGEGRFITLAGSDGKFTVRHGASGSVRAERRGESAAPPTLSELEATVRKASARE